MFPRRHLELKCPWRWGFSPTTRMLKIQDGSPVMETQKPQLSMWIWGILPKLESTQFLSLGYHPHGRWSQIWPPPSDSCARKSWISGLSSLSRRLVPVWIGQGCVRKSRPSQTNRHHEKGINCDWNGVFWKWKTPNANKLSSFAPFDDWGIPQYPGQYRNPPNGKVVSHHFRYVFEPAETPIFGG